MHSGTVQFTKQTKKTPKKTIPVKLINIIHKRCYVMERNEVCGKKLYFKSFIKISHRCNSLAFHGTCNKNAESEFSADDDAVMQ